MPHVLRLSDLISEGKLAGKRVFIRADLNVPQDDAGNITEDTRIRASVPAIEAALGAGAAVMVTSHLGRPTEGEFKPEDSLAPVAKRLAELLGRDVKLVQNWVDGVEVAPGQVVLLENCRVNKGEKKNSDELAQKMATVSPSSPRWPVLVRCWPLNWTRWARHWASRHARWSLSWLAPRCRPS